MVFTALSPSACKHFHQCSHSRPCMALSPAPFRALSPALCVMLVAVARIALLVGKTIPDKALSRIWGEVRVQNIIFTNLRLTPDKP